MQADSTQVLIHANARRTIAAYLHSASSSIEVLAYAITITRQLDSTLHPTVYSELITAPARGVRCRALIASHAIGSPHENSNTQAAIELTDAGWKARRMTRSPVLHAKMIIVDSRLVIAGSHNLTTAALETNRELSMLTTETQCVKDALNWFTELWQIAAPPDQSAPITAP